MYGVDRCRCRCQYWLGLLRHALQHCGRPSRWLSCQGKFLEFLHRPCPRDVCGVRGSGASYTSFRMISSRVREAASYILRQTCMGPCGRRCRKWSATTRAASASPHLDHYHTQVHSYRAALACVIHRRKWSVANYLNTRSHWIPHFSEAAKSHVSLGVPRISVGMPDADFGLWFAKLTHRLSQWLVVPSDCSATAAPCTTPVPTTELSLRRRRGTSQWAPWMDVWMEATLPSGLSACLPRRRSV